MSKSTTPRLTRMQSSGGRFIYYTLSAPHLHYHRVPLSYTAHMSKYKVIGKNLFVQSAGSANKVTPEWSLIQISELMKKHGKSATLKQVMAKSEGTKQWVPASAAEKADYIKRKARLDAYVVKVAAAALAKHRKIVVTNCGNYIDYMVRVGVLNNAAWVSVKAAVTEYAQRTTPQPSEVAADETVA